MGAWGEKTFEDDTSMDMIDEWMEADEPMDRIEEALAQALAQDYLEYNEGHVVSVIAALLDYTLNRQASEELDVDGWEAWLESLSHSRLEALRPKVIEGLDKLLGDQSELGELWAENEELYPKWCKILEDRRSRLRAS